MKVCVGTNTGELTPDTFRMTTVSAHKAGGWWRIPKGYDGFQFTPALPNLNSNHQYSFAFEPVKKGGRRGRGSRRVKRSGSKRSRRYRR